MIDEENGIREEIKELSKRITYSIQKTLGGKGIDIASNILFTTLSIVTLDIINSLGLPINTETLNVFTDTLKECTLNLIKENNLTEKLNNKLN